MSIDRLYKVAGEKITKIDVALHVAVDRRLDGGWTITACALHPQGGSPKGKAIWSASVQQVCSCNGCDACLPEPRAFRQFDPCERFSHGETRCAECRRHE